MIGEGKEKSVSIVLRGLACLQFRRQFGSALFTFQRTKKKMIFRTERANLVLIFGNPVHYSVVTICSWVAPPCLAYKDIPVSI